MGADCRVPIWGRGGRIRAYALVDAEDFDRVTAFRWHLDSHGYVIRTTPGPHGSRRSVLLHREILGLADPAVKTDHRNGDPLDNRRANLRPCTHAENHQNKISTKRQSSGYRGVHWSRQEQKWRAAAMVNGRRYYAGSFDDVQQAASAVAELRRRLMPFSSDAEEAAA